MASLSVPTPAEPRGEKNILLILGGEKLFGKVPVKKFKWPEKGYKFFGGVSNRFSDLFFHVFQTVFRVELNIFRGQFRSAGVPP